MSDQENHEISEVITRINRAWTSGNIADMADFLHEDIIMVAPEFGVREQGREKCMRGYREFMSGVTVVEFNGNDLQVDVIGDTVVTVYDFVLVYTGEDGRHRSTGKDLWVMKNTGGRWLAVWHTLLDVTDDIA